MAVTRYIGDLEFVPREAWGAKGARSVAEIHNVRGLAVHYSGMDADEVGDHARCSDRVRGIQRFHQGTRGWADIAYSFLVCKHGAIFEGRGAYRRSAANGTDAGNDRFLAVCFLGDDSAGRDDVTDAGRRALRVLWAAVRGWHPTAVEVVPHSQFKPTMCPGDELRAWIQAGMPSVDDHQEVDAVEQRYLDAIERIDRDTDALQDHARALGRIEILLHGFLRVMERERPSEVAQIRRELAALDDQ